MTVVILIKCVRQWWTEWSWFIIFDYWNWEGYDRLLQYTFGWIRDYFGKHLTVLLNENR